MLRDQLSAPIVVVGAGAAGLWTAKSLTEAGLPVILIDAGRAIDESRDYATTLTSADALSARPIQARCGACRGITARFFVDDIANPYVTQPGRPYYWFRGRQVGGRLHLWSRHVPRMSTHEFHATEGSDRSWPFDYGELSEHYAAVERFLKVEGVCDGLEHAPDGLFVPPRPLPNAGLEMSRRLKQSCFGLAVTRARIVQDRRTPLSLLTVSEHTGRLKLLSRTVVSSVTVDARGEAIGVVVIDRESGRRQHIDGSVVVLCASAFESTRLLLLTDSLAAESGGCRLDHSGTLGRFVGDHIVCSAWGPLSSDLSSASFGREAGDPWDMARSLFYLPACGRADAQAIGQFGIQLGVSPDGQSWFANAFGETYPREDNRLTLSPTIRDAWGVPALMVHFKYSENELRLYDDMKRTLVDLAHDLHLDIAVAPNSVGSRPMRLGAPGAAIHEVGGARVGSDASTSTLDPIGRSWSVRNLYVLDAATFPAGPFQNPTLTTMAIADRGARHIVRTLKGTS